MKKRHRVGKGKRAKVPSKIQNTIAHLKALQAARAAGYPVSYTTDPAWLLDEAINRRAGWVEDPHSRGTTQPCPGRLVATSSDACTRSPIASTAT